MLETAKSQWVRLYNVVAMCPYMIYIGNKYPMKSWEKSFMIFGGLATLLFNFRNYILDLSPDIPKTPYKKVPLGMSTVYDYPPERLTADLYRLVDVFLYGPAMMLIASRYKMTPIEEIFMWYTGASTVALNGANYLSNEKRKAEYKLLTNY